MNFDGYNQTSFKDLLEAFSLGREIEFHMSDQDYFLQPSYQDIDMTGKSVYCLYKCQDNASSIELFKGEIVDLLDYAFPNRKNLKNNFSEFFVDFIL